MTDLNRLRVSLTKHGAHKLATLLPRYGSSEILDHLWGDLDGVNIDAAQARKNLSVQGNLVHNVWDKAVLLDRDDASAEAVAALVLIGIIFSHRDLITAMAESTDANAPFTGTIIRGQHLKGKAYTNFAHTLTELGYATGDSEQDVRYNVQSLFAIKGLNILAVELLGMKLRSAGWDESNSVIDELLAHNFHRVFSVNAPQFKSWLLTGNLVDAFEEGGDLSFFERASDKPAKSGFVFTSGHNLRKTGTVGVAQPKQGTTAELLHNAMQNKLYRSLVAKHGEAFVGTEIATGADTFIDLVLKTKDSFVFYEIKTADTVKACIRQAIPQLLEYAYWDGAVHPSLRLIIVGPASATREASLYLLLLKETFGIPLEYEHLSIR